MDAFFYFYPVKKAMPFLIIILSLFACREEKKTFETDVNKDETYYSQLISTDSLNEKLWLGLGEYYLNTKMVSKGFDCLEKSFDLDSNNYDLALRISDFYFKGINIRKSEEYLKQCIRIDSTQTKPYLNIAQLNIFKANYKDAFGYINKGLRIDKYLTQAYFMKGVCYKHIGDTTKALSSFKTAIEIDPEYFLPYTEIGLLLTMKKDSNSFYYYKNALGIYPQNRDAWFGLGWSYQMLDKKELAIKEYEAFLQAYPNHENANFNIGLLYLFFENTINAKKYFNKVVSLQSHNIEAYINLHRCYKLEQDSIMLKNLEGIIHDLDSSVIIE